MTREREPLREEQLILTLFDVVNYLTKHGEVMAREGGLTVQQWLVLLQINNEPAFPRSDTASPTHANGVLASSIAEARGVSRANISALVSVLLRKKLVRQVEDPGDRRRKFLTIAAKGKQALEHIQPLRREVNAELFADFTEDEKRAALLFLQRCLEKLWHLGNGQETARPPTARNT